MPRITQDGIYVQIVVSQTAVGEGRGYSVARVITPRQGGAPWLGRSAEPARPD